MRMRGCDSGSVMDTACRHEQWANCLSHLQYRMTREVLAHLSMLIAES
jgi:hypothetical protein